MKKFFSLVRLLFVQQFRTRPTTAEKGKKKRGGAIALGVLLVVCFAPMIIGVIVAMYYMGKISAGNKYIGSFILLVSQGFVLVFGVHSIMSNVFAVRDADMLLYLPLHAPVIFLVKLTVAYLNELITSAVVVAISLLPFGIGAGASFFYYIMLPIALAVLPMLPMLVGTLVAMPLSALVTFFGKNSAIKTILRILIYVIIVAIYMYAMYNFGFLTGSENGNFFDNPEVYFQDIMDEFLQKLQIVMPYFHPDYMLMTCMCATEAGVWALGLAAALLENVALLGLVFLVSMPFYHKMLTLSVENGDAGKRGRKEQYKVKNVGVLRELMRADIKRTLRDAQVGFQSFAGIIMMPLVVVIMYFFFGLSDQGDASLLETMGISPLYQVVAPLVILSYMTFLGCSTNVLGLYPISRENKSLYVLKSLPVPFAKILLAKVLLATTVMLASDLLSCVLIVALFRVKWYYGIAAFTTMALVSFGSMCVTTLLDLKTPNLGWDNFKQGIKNGKNSIVAMLIAFLCVVAIVTVSVPFAILYGFTSGWYFVLLMWIANLALGSVFAAVAYKVMKGKADKYFERIEI